MKYTFVFLGLLIAAILATTSVHAACPDITATNTQALFNEIPSINTQLQTCPVQLQSGLGFLLSNPTQLTVAMNDGTTKTATITITNNQVTAVTLGSPASCRKQINTNERVLNSVLSSSNPSNAVLFNVGNKGFTISGCTFITRVSTFFTAPVSRFFARQASTAPAAAPTPQGPVGKPDYCDETYIQGHQGYAQNKALWDSYSADTTGVCQSQYGRGIPSPCVHSVQLSVSGNPYYLCWYNK